MERNHKKIFYLAGLILIFLISTFIIRKNKQHNVPSIKLSDLVLKDLYGNNISMASFNETPLVINFWGTWCGPCRQELPYFEKVSEKYKGQVNFMIISDEPVEKLVKFSEQNKYTFFYVQSQIAFHELGITSVPVTFFYDKNHRLINKTKYALTEDELNKFIIEILK